MNVNNIIYTSWDCYIYLYIDQRKINQILGKIHCTVFFLYLSLKLLDWDDEMLWWVIQISKKKLPVTIMFAKFQESMRLPGVDRWGVETYMHINHQ